MDLSVSIIIPTYNRAEALARTLGSVVKVVPPRANADVIVVDNGSTDHTALVCAAFREKYPRHVWRYFLDPMPGLLAGRHRGAREARGEILAYLDDDVLLSDTWWEALLDVFRNASTALAGGSSLPEFEKIPPIWLEGLWSEFEGGRHCAYLSLIDQGPDSKPCDPCLIFGLNYAVRKQALYECGGFHPDCIPKSLQRYQGDGETGLSVKIKEKGMGCMYHPGLALKHIIPPSRTTPEAFERRGFYQGVCDSYTQVRRAGKTGGTELWSWKDLLRPTKHRIQREILLRQNTVEAVGQIYANAHSKGFRWHQNEVRNDPKLLEWAIKPDYFDYALPKVWERDAADGMARGRDGSWTGLVLRGKQPGAESRGRRTDD